MDNEDLGGFKGECPLLGIGRVDSYDSESHSVYVRFTSWQMPFPARVLINGDCDGVRINQQPLPIRGTWGVVAFPRGDYRNAVWLGSFVNGTSYSSGAQSTDAINSSNSDIDSQQRYYSHFSGFYDLLDSQGNYFSRFPDGTQVLVNSNNQEPTTYRHVVNSEGQRQRVVFEDSYRTPNKLKPFYIKVLHPTGSSITIDVSGNVTITSPNSNTETGIPQQTSLTLSASGVVGVNTGESGFGQGPVLEINPISSAQSDSNSSPGDFNIIGQSQKSSIKMDQYGNVTIDSQGGAGVSIDVTATGDVNIAAEGSISIDAVSDINIDSSDTVNINAATQIILANGGGGNGVQVIGAVARVGDTTVCPAGVGSITSGSSKVNSG